MEMVSDPNANPSENRLSRWECILLVLIVLMGLGLRCSFLGRVSIEHFDEGVYASNVWFGPKQRFRYPARHLYAPTLVPGILEWSQILIGTNRLGTQLPGILAGTLLIPVIWRFARSALGPAAGLGAAAFVGLSDYHLLYSRTALTEPWLCLGLLASVFALWRALSEQDFKWPILAGVLTGLTWWAKYNGWLPLAIGTAALVAWSIRPVEAAPSRMTRWRNLGTVWGVALLFFAGLLLELRADGGYAVVQANHAKYVVGFTGWTDSLIRQFQNHRWIDGPLTWFSIFIAIAGIAGSQFEPSNPTKSGWQRMWWRIAWGVGLSGVAAWLGSCVVFFMLSMVWLIAGCPWWSRTKVVDDVFFWLIAAWFVGLLVATPLYTPYPRLSLPWLISAWMASMGALRLPAIQRTIQGELPWQQTKPAIGFAAICLLLGTVGVFFGFHQRQNAQVPVAFQDRAGIERTARNIQKEIRTQRCAILIYGEPAMFYHIRAISPGTVIPIADLGWVSQGTSNPIFLVFGSRVEFDSNFQNAWETAKHRFELVRQFDETPSDLVSLNQYSPTELRKNGRKHQAFFLYRLVPL